MILSPDFMELAHILEKYLFIGKTNLITLYQVGFSFSHASIGLGISLDYRSTCHIWCEANTLILIINAEFVWLRGSHIAEQVCMWIGPFEPSVSTFHPEHGSCVYLGYLV